MGMDSVPVEAGETAAATSPPTATCTKCKLSTIVPQFLTRKIGFSQFGESGVFCPRCLERDRTVTFGVIAGFIFAAFLGLFFCWVFQSAASRSDAIENAM